MSVLTVNGAAIPSPSELAVAIFEIGSGPVRTASGSMAADCVAVKRRLTLRWAHMLPAQLGALLGQVSGAFFEAGYPDPMSGAQRTADFRAGEITLGVMKVQDGAPVWTDVRMEWTER